MPFPQTLDDMRAAGYIFSNHGTCRGCGDEIEWWATPRGKSMPMNPMASGSSKAESHWATCTERDSFRN